MIRKPRTEKKFNLGDDTLKNAAASLNRIFKTVELEGLSEDAVSAHADDIRIVSERFGVCPKAAVLFAAILEKTNSSNSCDDEDLANYVGCTNIEFLGFHEALRELEDKGVVTHGGSRRPSYRATTEAVKAVEKDTEFTPVKTTELTSDEFFTFLRRLVSNIRQGAIDADRFHEEVVTLVDRNQQLLFCRKLAGSPLWTEACTDTERRQFFYLCHRYVSHGNPYVPIDVLMNLTDMFDDDMRLRRRFANESSGLQKAGLVTFGNENGFVNNDTLALSDEVKAGFFAEVELAPEEKVNHKDLIRWESIKEQELFYNPREAEAVARLADILDEEHFKQVQARLQEQGMPRGVSAIFYGGPGSGKTATLKALARKTRRDLFWVDLSALKSKWVGDSEKQVKALFDTYRALVRTSERAPILAVNEADALFTKRLTKVEQSTDLMNNAITDIVLNELETLDGILIATTNLVGNMMDAQDNAMERRFLFKIAFDAPKADVRARIWQSKLPHISEADASALASDYPLSGGNIDNVARKSVVDYVLTGAHADLPTLRKYCGEEALSTPRKTPARIGF